MAYNPRQIRYPYSFWMAFGSVVITALLSVSWHSLLFLVAIVDLISIGALPVVSRWEMQQAINQAGIGQPSEE